LIQTGRQAAADRYTYVPYIGLFIGSLWLILDHARARNWHAGTACVLLLLLAATGRAAYIQTGYWRSSIALWENTLSVTRGNFIAHVNLAAAYRQAGRSTEALAQLEQAGADCPDTVRAYMTMASLWARVQPERTVDWVRRAIELKPGESALHFSLAEALQRVGRIEDAAQAEMEGERLLAIELRTK
jgi:tetratricopeptide (TPR) repeat protein